MDTKQSKNKQSFLEQALEIPKKSQTYFAQLGKKEPLVAMDEQNRICKYYPNGEVEVLKDLTDA